MSGGDAGAGRHGPLRLLLAVARPLLGDLLRAELETHPSMAVVSRTVPLAEIAGAVQEFEPDLVVCALDADDAFLSQRADAFVSATPARILAILADGRRSALWELRPYRTPLGEFSG